MRSIAPIALLIVAQQFVAAEPPAGDGGDELKAAAISKLESAIEAATERKAQAGKAGDKSAFKQALADLKHLKAQLLKAKAKPPEEHAKEAAERAKAAEEAAKLAAEKNREEERQKWYEGGTLHKKTVAEWSKAAQRDKVATSADFVSHAWKAGVLKDFIANGIKGMDDIKPLAERLASEIDLFYSQGKLAGGSDVALAAAQVMGGRWTKPQ